MDQLTRTTTFAYDADGQRILTIQHDGVRVYTPFAEYEETVTGTTTTQRSTYYLAGQLIAVRVKVSGGSNELYYTYTDHLGSVAAMSYSGGTYRANSLARYDPFGNHRTLPGWIINPGISDRGFTGHIHDNTSNPTYPDTPTTATHSTTPTPSPLRGR